MSATRTAILAFLLSVPALAGNSTDYSVDAVLDGGGTAGSSADYALNPSMGPGAAGSSAGYAFRGGFSGMLSDTASLVLSAAGAADSMNERATLQFEARIRYDDDTVSAFALPAAYPTWSVAEGPIAAINNAGKATAGSVYQDTPATVRAIYQGLEGLLPITVRNLTGDDFGSYAADGLPDLWQVQYFGESALPAVAGADADPDADGLTNFQEYTFGTDPSVVSSGVPLSVILHDRQASPIIFTGDPVVYTFTFNRDIDLSTFAPSDLRNASATTPATFTIGSITEQGFTRTYVVTVIPTSVGLLDLRIAQGAQILDDVGFALDTSGGDLGAGGGNPTITVTARNQVITFPQPSSMVYGISPGFALGATASSGLPVSYTLNSGPVTLVDGFVTPIGVGEVSITATQAGDATNTPAEPVTRTFNVLILGTGTAPRMNIRSNGLSIRSGGTRFFHRDNTDFGKYTSGESVPKTNVYTIENLGDRTLILSNVSAPVTLTNLSGPAAFRVVQPSFTSVLGGGRLTANTVDFSIVFEPTTVGVTEAEISIQNSDSNRSPYTFLIRGEAIASPAPTDLILVDNRVQYNVLSVGPSGTAAGLLSPVPVVGTDYTYSIVGGTDASLFNIPTGTNQLRLNIGETPDIVAKPKYFVRIRVTRGAATFEKDFEVIVMTVASKEGDFVVNDRGPSDSGVDISGSGQILLVSKDSAGAAYVSQTYRTDIVDPYEIAVEADGDFIIANYEHVLNTLTLKPDGGIYRIDRITAERTKVTGNTGAQGEVVLRTPLGVEVESDGNIIVADADYSPDGGTTFTGGVIRVNPSTGAKTLLASGGTLEYVQGIGLNPVSGEIYISNIRFPLTRGGQIIRVNKTTGQQTVITPSSGPNIVRFPVGIACEADGQSLVVADAFAQRLIKIDLTTGNQSYLTALPETLDPLSSEPKLDFPTHVAIEADGNYIVTDGRDDLRPRRVIRIDKGTGIASLIVGDTGNSFFDQPRGVRIAK